MWIHFLLLFIAGLVMDALWALNVQLTVTHRAKTAATTSALLVFGSVLSVVDVVSNGWIPLCGYTLGAWVGTWLVVRHDPRRKTHLSESTATAEKPGRS